MYSITQESDILAISLNGFINQKETDQLFEEIHKYQAIIMEFHLILDISSLNLLPAASRISFLNYFKQLKITGIKRITTYISQSLVGNQFKEILDDARLHHQVRFLNIKEKDYARKGYQWVAFAEEPHNSVFIS